MTTTKPISFFTSQLDGEVILRKSKKEEFESSSTIHELMLDTATKFPDLIALGTRKPTEWDTITYIEYYELCRKAAKSLLKLGLERFHGVGILGDSSSEWFIMNIASIFAGGISVAIFPHNSFQACRFIGENCMINIFVVEDDWQLQKVFKIQRHLHHLKAIIQYKEKLTKKLPNVYSWNEFIDQGVTISDEILDRTIDAQKPNQCCMLVYTMGTTGPPKPVMISHDNITWTVGAVLQSLSFTQPPDHPEIFVSYLPLYLITAQIFDVWLPISIAASVFIAEPEAIRVRESLVSVLREVRPTTFCGIPEVWEKLQEKLNMDQMTSTAFKKSLIIWAKKVGLKRNLQNDADAHVPVAFRVAKKLIFDKVRRNLGLDRCLQFLSSGAGLSREIQEFYLSFDITLLQMYGMTECTGPHAISTKKEHKLFSCGKAILGSKSIIQYPDKEGIGEIYLWGRHLFMGYLNNEYKTKKVFDQKGWLHTGDMGILDEEHYFHITGRTEEIIITYQGEKIFPGPIEDMLKENIPIIRHAMIVGNQAKFLSALLTLKCECDPDTGEPHSMLTEEATIFCRRHESKAVKVTDIIDNHDPIIDAIIQKGIDEINMQTDFESHKILKWKVLEKDFSIVGGELGPSMNMRRSHITRMYQMTIASFYI